ncbi:hypothetical protein QBC33DRAFT_516547 [Phialemonium atrogriseum]|uniref:Uncharacterized protein n=1 Tax=Phialemonium atrogriseum TaxID=1093897 RepID=A0AAJ0BWQ1_9PEZI|nr:uncharacterized protein QBC33DRAFT_516547 [Phialemonium atrogriseum]KAK1765661.1 hypothetical protein QBC33DRAFT_516547 [Phialemonium atrogriseum]
MLDSQQRLPRHPKLSKGTQRRDPEQHHPYQHRLGLPKLGTEIRGPAPPQPGAVPIPPGSQSGRGTSTDYPSGPSYSARGFEQAGAQPHLGNPSGPSYSAGGFEQSGAQSHRANSLANPPGYQQYVSASEVNGDQRAGYDSLGFSGRGSTGPDEDEEGVWDSAKKWAQTAGGKLSAAENEVWRRINKG